MNKPIYLGLSVLDISKTLMSKFWYDYIKPKHREQKTRTKLRYTATDILVIHTKLKIFAKTLLMMLKDGSIHLTIMKTMKDHFH